MRLRQLQDFIDIVDAGGIRAAARRRGVSQPVLTKSLQSLEARVGVRLLERTAKGVRLTAPGRTLLARARAAQKQLQHAIEEIDAVAGARAPSVAFGASAAAMELLPAALARFKSAYPESYVRVVEGSPTALGPLLRDETLDFFVGPRPRGIPDPHLRTRPLFRLALAVAGRKGHPMRRARTLADLVGQSWLLLSAGGWNDSMLGDAFRAAGLSIPSTVVQCESYATAVALLRDSDTVGLMPREHLRTAAWSTDVEEIEIEDRLPALPFEIYLRASDTLTRPAEVLLRSLLDAAHRMTVEARRTGTAA